MSCCKRHLIIMLSYCLYSPLVLAKPSWESLTEPFDKPLFDKPMLDKPIVESTVFLEPDEEDEEEGALQDTQGFPGVIDLFSLGDYQAEVGIEWRGFPQEGLQGQAGSNFSARILPEMFFEWNDGDDSLLFKPYFRVDQRDPRRTHFDVRELLWTHFNENYVFKAGVGKVFWGTTESQHLADIINQTDLVDNINAEEKLGQPMISISFERDWGILDLFLMTGARKRIFSGQDGRFRFPLVVDVDNEEYESGAEEFHIDFAIRYFNSFGDLDLGVYHFSGNNREPRLCIRLPSNNQLVCQDSNPNDVDTRLIDPNFLMANPSLIPSEVELVPVYDVIDQTGIDLQYNLGDLALKLEAISRSGQGDRFTAATFGFEYTIVGIFDTRADVGLISEYLFDDRKEQAPPFVFEQDILFGTRFTLNDAQDTNILVGLVWDPETEERLFSVEASRRLGDNWKLIIDARVFTGGSPPPATDTLSLLIQLANPDPTNKLDFLQKDDFIQVELVRFF